MKTDRPKPVLELVDLIASYRPGWTIGPVNLRVARGEIIGIVGPNGSGKSTFFRCIIGDAPRVSGRVILDGRDISDMPVEARMRAGISYQPQHGNVFPTLTVRENLQIASRAGRHSLDPLSLKELRAIAEPVAALPTRRANLLSGGDQQSLALAMALTVPAIIYLFDEPLAGLSPDRVIRAGKIIAEQVRGTEVAAVIAEHRVEHLNPICDRVLQLQPSQNSALPSFILVPVQN